MKFKLILIIGLPSLTVFLLILFPLIICSSRRRRRRRSKKGTRDLETEFEAKEGDGFANTDDFMKFQGGKDLIVQEILDAPGEVIGKSSYGTLYRANLVHSDKLTLLRFLRPTCTLKMKEILPIVGFLGSIRHPNLVPLTAFYAGYRGEKLMVHPFYGSGNLAQFIREGNGEARKWPVIIRIAIGIARGIHHLHTSLVNPVIHGNLKSKNILLDSLYHPRVSDFGLYLLLNSYAAQKMLESSSQQGYNAPELIKMKDASQSSDIYSFGVILLELLSAKELVDSSPIPDQDLYLPCVMRSAILDDRITDLYHPDILLGLNNVERVLIEDCILGFFQLAMACCSPSRILRPNIKEVLEKLEQIGK